MSQDTLADVNLDEAQRDGRRAMSQTMSQPRWVAYPTCGALTRQGGRCLRDRDRRAVAGGQASQLCSYHARLARRVAVALSPVDAGSGGSWGTGEGLSALDADRIVCEAMTAAGDRCRGTANYAVALGEGRRRWLCGHHAKLARRGSVALVPIDVHDGGRVPVEGRSEA